MGRRGGGWNMGGLNGEEGGIWEDGRGDNGIM